MAGTRYSVAALCAVLALGRVGPAEGQIPLTPRALAMGGSLVANATGFESIFYNPANLGLPGTPAWSVAFPQITVGSSVLGPDVSDLPDFLNYDDQDPARRQELLALIPESGTSVDLVARAPVAALQVGGIGVGLSYGWLGEHTLGKDLVELFFEGYEQGRYDYSVGNTVGTRATFWDLAAGYGRRVGPVSVGATAHLYRGKGLVRSQAFEPQFDPLGQTIRVEYVGVAAEGGSGYGLDVGVAYQPIPRLTVGASVANLISSMSWDEELIGRNIVLTEQDFQNSEYAALEDRYESSRQELGTNPTGRFAQVAQELDRQAWDLPRTLRLGAAFKAPTGTEVSAAYQSDITDGLLGGRWSRLLGVGVEQRLPFVSLRVGASTNLEEGSMVGGGVRLGVLDVGIARFSTAGTLDDADRDGWAASFSVNVRTRGTR